MPISNIPHYLKAGFVLTKSTVNWLADTLIYPEGHLLIEDRDGNNFSFRIADGVHLWNDLKALLSTDSNIKYATGTILRNTNTITFAPGYDRRECNVLLFLGGVKQAHNSLIFVDDTTIKLNEVVYEDTAWEIVSIPRSSNITLPEYSKDYMIDGTFDFWYEGTSQSTGGYGSDTMWYNGSTGSTKVHSRQSFAIGELFPDGVPTPTYYSRTVVTSVAGSGNLVYKRCFVEDVTKLAGKTVTFSFYAKADAVKNIAIEFYQYFGSGGNPSANVPACVVRTVTLSTTWAKYTLTGDIPKVPLNSVLGTDNNHGLIIHFYFDAGSNYSTRTNNLIQQSGTFDLAKVSLVEGDSDVLPLFKPYAQNLREVSRYFIKIGEMSGQRLGVWGRHQGTTYGEYVLTLPVPMAKVLPTFTVFTIASINVWNGAVSVAISALSLSPTGSDATKSTVYLSATAASNIAAGTGGIVYTLNATPYITLDART